MGNKICILTFAQGDNYGAVLQAYGLAKVLRQMGYDPQFVYYTWDTWKYRIISRMTPLRRRFANFREKYIKNFSLPCYNKEDLAKVCEDADICIVGSDQVWNPAITKHRALHYFFDYLPDGCPRIAYAASFGRSNWDFPELYDDVKVLLSKFNQIGVREDSGVSICSDIFDVKAVQVLDPTLLAGNFNEILKYPRYKHRLVGFMFNPSREYYQALGIISDILNVKTLVMDLPSRKTRVEVLKHKVSPFSSVEDWVTNIAYSEFIVTDSFHCLSFAIMYQKQFIFIASNKTLMGRAVSILSILGIKDRIYSTPSEVISSRAWLNRIDYNEVQAKLEVLRAKSMTFLEAGLAVLR